MELVTIPCAFGFARYRRFIDADFGKPLRDHKEILVESRTGEDGGKLRFKFYIECNRFAAFNEFLQRYTDDRLIVSIVVIRMNKFNLVRKIFSIAHEHLFYFDPSHRHIFRLCWPAADSCIKLDCELLNAFRYKWNCRSLILPFESFLQTSVSLPCSIFLFASRETDIV